MSFGQGEYSGSFLVEKCSDATRTEFFCHGREVDTLAKASCFEVCISVCAGAALVVQGCQVCSKDEMQGRAFKPSLIETCAGGLGRESAWFDESGGAVTPVKMVISWCQAAVFIGDKSDLNGIGTGWRDVAANHAEDIDQIASGCCSGHKVSSRAAGHDGGRR